jgi:hypothetical protein
MTNPHAKSPAPAATGTGENENLGQDISMNNQPTRPAITAWNRAVDGHTIPNSPDLCDLRWGEDLEHQPGWTAYVTPTGTAVSDAVLVRAQQYDGRRPDKHGTMVTVEGQVHTTVVQGAEDAFPSVLVDLRKLGRDSEGRRALVTAAQIRLYPHEVQPLIEALSVARDLVDEEGK